MKLTYLGPMPEVFVPVHDPYLDIAIGDTVEFGDDVAASLLEQTYINEFDPGDPLPCWSSASPNPAPEPPEGV